MKKALLTIGTSLLVLGAQAQAGSWYIGGNAGYNVTQQNFGGSKGPKNSTWSFSPEIGTFLTDNFQLGAAITLAGEQLVTNGNDKTVVKSNMTGGSVYARYFFGNGLFRPFLGMNITVLPGSATYTDVTRSDKYQTMNYGANINAGFALALSSRVTAVGSFGALGYNNTTTKMEGVSSSKQVTESFGFNNAGTLGQRFNVGIYYTFLK
ncbi:MAG: outer membrane beta-barrel protein [Taibaiella sp.]|nr:outer membrane beta-barrel protein [Taibaiella sp.]